MTTARTSKPGLLARPERQPVHGDGDRRIFVQIPAYLDADLPYTLLDLYRTATRPELLRTVVLWQKATSETMPAKVHGLPNLTVVEWPSELSQGPNWARELLRAQRGDEPFTLLLDSHHRFVPGWDDLVIGMHDSLRLAGIEKPLLTTYLPSFVPGKGPELRGSDVHRIYPLQREDGILTRLTSYPIHGWRALDAPISADYLSLHFVFAGGEFNETAVIDPDVYFFGDEIAAGLRAYTHGWDMFHPHRIIGWHAYSRSARQPHWDTHPDWYVAHRKSLEHLRALFTDSPQTRHLLGGRRTVAEYESFIMQKLVKAS